VVYSWRFFSCLELFLDKLNSLMGFFNLFCGPGFVMVLIRFEFWNGSCGWGAGFVQRIECGSLDCVSLLLSLIVEWSMMLPFPFERFWKLKIFITSVDSHFSRKISISPYHRTVTVWVILHNVMSCGLGVWKKLLFIFYDDYSNDRRLSVANQLLILFYNECRLRFWHID